MWHGSGVPFCSQELELHEEKASQFFSSTHESSHANIVFFRCFAWNSVLALCVRGLSTWTQDLTFGLVCLISFYLGEGANTSIVSVTYHYAFDHGAFGLLPTLLCILLVRTLIRKNLRRSLKDRDYFKEVSAYHGNLDLRSKRLCLVFDASQRFEWPMAVRFPLLFDSGIAFHPCQHTLSAFRWTVDERR